LKRLVKVTAALTFGLVTSCAFAQNNSNWNFAVSGDSRNCGDIVMPAIAKSAHSDNAAFYWHLGDFRAFYAPDEDLLAARHGQLSVAEYERSAWQDFIDQQLAPFGDMPVFLAMGNHELVSKTRPDAFLEFADWFDSPVIRSQRLSDDPSDHKLRGYYHWHEHNLDFITMDNASPEQFDHDQLVWFEKTLNEDAEDRTIRTVIVGMHDALPDSISAGHSMNESATGTETGRRVYSDLVDFQKRSGKEVQVVSSHAHFLMSDVYKTSCHKPEDVLPGWIVGTAGAVRYRLPREHSAAAVAKTDVYGYLLGKVNPEGHVSFVFRPIPLSNISAATRERYGAIAVLKCFEGNKSDYRAEGPKCAVR
jgi:hypothetical protein